MLRLDVASKALVPVSSTTLTQAKMMCSLTAAGAFDVRIARTKRPATYKMPTVTVAADHAIPENC